MGTVFSTCRTCCCCLCCCNRNEYQPIDNNDIFIRRIKSNPKYFHVLDGCSAGTKFTGKTSYDEKYLWINVDDKTIHVSPFTNKNKEHKEASMLDIIKVSKCFPKRYSNKNKLNIDCCITIEFERGGSIDILFENSALRDSWFEVLTLSCPQISFKSPIPS